MAEMIPIVERSAGLVNWSGNVTVGGRVDPIKFRVAGGTFDDSTTEKTVSPASGSDYTISLRAIVSVDESSTQPVVVYYEDSGSWVMVHSLSRIFVLPRKKTLDYRMLTKGVDAMPLGASLDPAYNGLVIGGGVRFPTQDALQQAPTVKVNDLENAPFQLNKPVSFIYDRHGQTLYFVHTDGDVANTKLFGSMPNVDLAGYRIKYDATGKRTGAVLFHSSGRVDVLDEAMTQVGQSIQLGYKVNRVVCRRAGVYQNANADTYVAFDREGRAHYLDAAFTETRVRSDKFYVNCSDNADILSTATGELVGFVSDNGDYTPPATTLWYQFPAGSTSIVGWDTTQEDQHPAYSRVHEARYVFAGNGSRTNTRDADRVFYWTDGAWSNTGNMSQGLCTDGSDALVGSLRGSDGLAPVTTRDGWSILSVFNPPYTEADSYDRLFYYAARPSNNLKHLALRNYNTVWPDLSAVELGPTVSFTLTVEAEDPDLPLPISVPAGVNMTATVKVVTVDEDEVEHVTQVPVTKVFDGDEVTITLSHAYVTSTSFPVSIGRTVYQFEAKIDDTPDAFHWDNILGVDNDTWNRTADVTISGINVSVPVSVLIDGSQDDERVKIYIDGVETPQPAVIRNGQKLGLEILHDNNTSRVSVTVGQTSSSFGIYTIVEAVLDVGRHWAYMPIGKQVRSDVLKNTGTIPLTLTITDTDAQFTQGGKTVTLPVDGTTSILFTPTENKKYTVKFQSEQHSYEWYVWADDVWLGETPPVKRAERYVMDDSDDIFFENVPQNFWTYITVPAGMLLDVDGVRVEQELDSRGVYKEQGLVIGPFECAETMLKIYGFPSHDQPHTLMLGNAPLGWLYDMTTDPTYHEYWTDSINLFDVSYDARTAEAVEAADAKTYISAGRDVVILTPKYDPELDVQLQWLDFSDARTHAADSVPVSFETQERPDANVIAGPQFITGQKDFVDNFRMADLIARSEIKFDKFDLFEMVQGTSNVAQTTPLATFIGTDRGSAADEFDLFEAVTGKTDTATEFPLFESIVGNTITADSFWPDFDTESTIVDDTFANNFAEQLLDAPQYFDLFAPEYRSSIKAKSDQIRPRFVEVKGRYSAPKTEPDKIEVRGTYPQKMTDGAYRQSSGNYPQQMSTAVWSRSSETYHVEWARPLWRPVSVTYKIDAMSARYVDPLYHPIVLFMKEIPFVRWHKPPVTYNYAPATPERSGEIVNYPVAPAVGEFEQLKLVAAPVDVAEPSFKATAPVYQHDIVGKHITLSSRIGAEPLTPDLIKAPRVIKAQTIKGVQTTRSPIRVKVQTTKKAENKVYGIPTPVIETWLAPPNHGSINKPLEEGYFASELDALQNATQVWGYDASMVYAIQQPNGYWTWAQITVCEESCGSMSCAARGYLSGG